MRKTDSVNALKNEVKELKSQLEAVKKDRQVFRDFMTNEFRSQLQNMIKKEYTPGEMMVKKMTIALNRAEYFYLGL